MYCPECGHVIKYKERVYDKTARTYDCADKVNIKTHKVICYECKKAEENQHKREKGGAGGRVRHP